MEYYYTPGDKVKKDKGILVIDDEFEYRHLAKVLRKKPGDKLDITDGERNIYRCEIAEITKDKIECRILETEHNLFEPDRNVHLYIAPLKNSDRFEFAVEKAVELGVVSITPVITKNTVKKMSQKETNFKRLHRIIISAMGQSQRCLLPKLDNIITFGELLERERGNKNRIVMYEFSEKDSKFVYDNTSKDVYLLIGPEGGFSKEEIEKLRESGWQAASLGERKLRAETAAIVSVFQILNRN